MPKLTVEVSKAQLQMFSLLTEGVGGTAGEVMLALACDALRGAPPSGGDAEIELGSILWEFCHCRAKPRSVDEWLSSEAAKRLTFDHAPKKGVGHA